MRVRWQIKHSVALLAVAVLLALFTVIPLLAAMTDSTAMTEAYKLFGPGAMISKVRKFGDSNWTTQVGFRSPGCQQPFTIVAAGNNTWDAAFLAIPPGGASSGPYSGLTMLTVQSGDVPGAVFTFQFLIDGLPVGNKLSTGTIKPWAVSTPWDTTEVTDGFHVVCGIVTNTDGTSGATRASLLVVKQQKLQPLNNSMTHGLNGV